MRTSPIHYIAPSSIEITPNANNSYNDLAVYIAPVTDIKVYCPRLGIGTANGTYSVWQLYGRNRRLNDSRDGYSHTKAYTIYARLSKADSGDGYIVFTPKQQYGNKWYDKYSYITKDGLGIRYNAGADSEPRVFDDANYWYVKLGEVSAADSTNQRTVNLDTGILGTDQWNSEWALNPDALPLRIDMEYRLRNVADEEWDEWTAITRYVRWNQVLHVKAQLVEGWTGTDINRFHHWEITRDTGNADADGTWNEAHDSRDGDSGDYTKTDFDLNLVHLRGIGDDFNGVLQALFTLTAYELNPDYTAGSEEPQYLPLISSSFSVIAETVETFDLEESSSTVTYNPQTGAYVPAMNSGDAQKSGVTIRVRATDADGKTFYPTTDQINTIGLHVYCRPIDDDTTPVEVTLTNGRGTLPSAPFLAGKSVEVWLQVGAYSSSSENIILSQKTITYIRFGAKGDTPINCYRWYKEGLIPVKPTATNSDEPAPASGDATGASNVYPTDKWSSTVPNRPSTGEWLLWMCSSIRHGDNTRDAWSGPVQMSGTKGDAGEDATDREYIYKRLNTYPFSGTSPASITTDTSGTQRTAEYIATHDDFVPQGWSDTAMPATSSEKYVYMSVRIKEPGQRWGAFSAPVLWTNWGVQGMDGDGVQYLYKLFSEELDESGRMSQRPSGATFNETTKEWECTGWSDDPLAPTSSSPFCYCAIIKKINGSWNEDLQHHGVFEKLGLWSKWAKDGDSITKQSETPYYIKNTTGVRPAENDPNWSTTKPTLGQGEWLFTKTVVTWSDSSTTVLYTDERNPNDGAAGQDIIVDGATVMKYYVGDSNTTHPADGSSDWKDLSQVTQEQGKWLWSQATTYYRKASSTAGSHDAGTSINYNVSYIAEDGKTGRGIQSITEYYQATNSSAARQAPSSETGWDTDPNLSHLTDKWDQSHKYLWNMEKTVYSNVDGSTTTEYSVPQILAIWTKDGDAGKGIDSIQNYYKVTDKATAPSKPATPGTEGWRTTPIVPGQGEYLWNYEIITWVNGTPATTETDVQMIGYAGTDGTSVIAQYSVDGTSNWHSTFAAGDKYMRTSADGGTTWGSAIKIVGEDGSDGQNGDYIDSSFGISSKLVGDNQDGSPSDISTWSDAPIATTTQKPYLWCKQVSHTFSGSTETVGTPKYFRMTGADAVVYKIEFTDNTFALDPNTNKSVISIKGVVYRTEGSNTPTQVSLTGQDLAMRYIKNDGTTQELSLGGDFGIQNNEFVCTAGNGSFNTNFKTFVVEYKPDRQNILARGIIALTVYGEKGMEAIRGYADYLYDADDTGSMPAPSAAELGKINLKEYSGNQNRIEICELVSGSYVWKGYGKTDYPDGTMFVCKIDNHIYRASASGWIDEGRFKGDNAVVYKIDFTDSTFAYDPNNHCNVVDVKGIVYKIDGGNTSVFTSLGTGSSLELYFLHEGRAYDDDPVTLYTVSNGSFSTTQRNGAETRGEKGILAIVKIGDNEVARANIAISQYAEDGSRGKRGRSYYYAQPWENTSDVYLVNDSVAPYFLYNDNYYVYNPVDDIDGPVAMSAMGVPGSNDNWERMTNEFKYIITEAIFGKYADFGSFRITGNWLYSELGEFLGENTEEHPNFLHKLYDFRKSYPDDVTEVNLPACNYIHPEDPNITYVEIYDDSEESGSTIPTVTTKTNILTDDDDAWQNLKSGVIYSFSAYFANCKFYLRKNRVKRASIVLYKRSSTTISAHGITTTLYYKFSDGKLYTKNGNVYTEATDADLNNWKLEKPADNGNPCYVIQAAALGAGDYDQIQTTAWSEANILHTGDQVDVRYVRLYKRSSSAVTTVGINTALYYKFSDGKLYTDAAGIIEATSSDLNGWSLKAPTGSTDQLYLTAAIANRYTESDKITSSEWVTPTPLTVDDLTLMYSSSSPTTQLVYFELAEDGEYQFIVEKYVQSQSGSAYLNWVIIREHYFLAYIAINGRNGYILQRNSHGHYNGTGNFTEAGIGSANIRKMHSGGAYSEGTWIDIENGRLDISRYSQVRVVQYNNGASSSGVQVLGYLYVDSSGTIKVSSEAQDFYNPNEGNIPAT